MSQAADSKICVVWENELRAVGLALRRLTAALEGKENKEEAAAAMQQLYEVSWAALYHLAQPDASEYACIVIGPKPAGKKRRRP